MRCIGPFFASLLAASGVQAQDVVLVGDSILAWNRETGESIGDALASQINKPVANLAESGALFMAGFWEFGEDIPAQLDGAKPDILILTGGGNDVEPGCGTRKAAQIIDRMIAADLSGELADFVEPLTEQGTQVVYLAYYDLPDITSEFTPCRSDLLTLEARAIALADQTDGFRVAAGRSAIDPADLTLYDPDGIHPSPAGAALLGALLADTIRQLP